MKLWCFGDSNTYGYDPSGFFGGRYAASWPELLARYRTLAERLGTEYSDAGE